MDKRERRGHTRCSFCGKGQDQVRKLVAGPGVYICDSCIQLCHDVLEEDRRKGPPPHKSQQEAVRTAATRHHPSFLERLRSRLWRTVPPPPEARASRGSLEAGTFNLRSRYPGRTELPG